MFTWWLSTLKKYLIRQKGVTAQELLNKCQKKKKTIKYCFHMSYSQYILLFLPVAQTKKKCASLSSVLFLLPKTKLSSVMKFLNAFSTSLLKKQRTQSWTLKIIYCGVTDFSGHSLSEPLADPFASIILNLVVKWGWAYKLKSTWLKEFFARVRLSDQLSPSFPFPL